MTKKNFKYSFKGKVWRSPGPGGWYFVTLPKKLSKEIREVHFRSEEGWGRLKTNAFIQEHSWETAIWYDTKAGSYIIPIKTVIRKKTATVEGSRLEIHLEFSLEKWLIDII